MILSTVVPLIVEFLMSRRDEKTMIKRFFLQREKSSFLGYQVLYCSGILHLAWLNLVHYSVTEIILLNG